MTDSDVYVIVVGHNLEAKCDVANALAQQKKLFRSFSCRKKIVLKSRCTVHGKHLYIIATPDLSTPAWKHQEKDLEKFTTKVFLYVVDNDCIDTDNTGWVEYLQKRFQPRARRNIPLVSLRYNTRRGRESSLEDLSQIPDDDQVTFNQFDLFTVKKDIAGKKLRLLIEDLKEPRATFEGKMAVDDDGSRVKACRSESANSQDSGNEVLEILESVTITYEVYNREEEFRSKELPNINDDDWDLFRRTLRTGRARSNHVRVNIVGNQGAGKTTLVKRLQEIDIKCPDGNQRPTEGLEINQVTTRCTEKEGARYWETNYVGYEEELNLQRMAFALHYVENSEQNNGVASEAHMSDEMAELAVGSDEVEDEPCIQKSLKYGEHINIKEKELYLQKVKRWKENSFEERMYVSYWDFAGQTTYYSSHQAFLAPSAVYVLVIDLSLDLNQKLQDSLEFRMGPLKHYTVEETVKFWISSIKAYTRDEQNGHAPFIIVGTHKDKVTPEKVKEKFSHLRQVLKTLTQVEFVAIDNTLSVASDSDLQTLRNKILNLGLGVIDEEIPAQWINLENLVLQEKNKGRNLLSFSQIEQLDARSDMPMKDPIRIEAFLEHEHRRGWLMHFCHSDMKDIIILQPTFLANYFNELLRQDQSYQLKSSGLNKNGIIHKNFILEAASRCFSVPEADSILTKLTSVLTHIHIMHQFGENTYFFPCLMPHREDWDTLKDSRHHEKTPTLKLSFADAFVPPAFYHLLIAAMIEEKDLTVYEKNNVSHIYNLFVRFCYQRQTLWLEIYWHNCCIYFEMKNYSSHRRISESGCNKMIEVTEIIQKKIEDILCVYRQDNVRYTFEIECPRHVSTFVDLQKARENGEVMCSDGPEFHSVSWEEISQIFPWSPNTCQDTLEINHEKPKDKDLGRLARNLTRENAISLASKLKLPQGNTLADQAVSEWCNWPDMQRLRLLITWKERNPDQSVTDLLQTLTKRRDYDMKMLTEVLSKEIDMREDYGLSDTILDSVPYDNYDLLIVSDHIGAKFAFLMLELGLTFQDIEIKRFENQHALKETIFKLLQTWRQSHGKEATPRVILNTAHFLGINTTDIVSKFKERLCK